MNYAALSREALVKLVQEQAGKVLAQDPMSATYIAAVADQLYKLALHINKIDVMKTFH